MRCTHTQSTNYIHHVFGLHSDLSACLLLSSWYWGNGASSFLEGNFAALWKRTSWLVGLFDRICGPGEGGKTYERLLTSQDLILYINANSWRRNVLRLIWAYRNLSERLHAALPAHLQTGSEHLLVYTAVLPRARPAPVPQRRLWVTSHSPHAELGNNLNVLPDFWSCNSCAVFLFPSPPVVLDVYRDSMVRAEALLFYYQQYLSCCVLKESIHMFARQGRVWLIDFNPFGEVTDSLLFTWEELTSGANLSLQVQC